MSKWHDKSADKDRPAEKPPQRPWREKLEDPATYPAEVHPDPSPAKPAKRSGRLFSHPTLASIPNEVARLGKYGVTLDHLEEALGHDRATPDLDLAIQDFCADYGLRAAEDEHGTIWFELKAKS